MGLGSENTAMATALRNRSKTEVKRRKRLQEDRVAEILDVAAEVFIAEGFAAASTNTIARLAKASKTTFYSRFPTKEDLFLAVIERRMTRIFEQVASIPDGLDLKSSLEKFGASLLEIALSPDQIALIRVVSMESGRYPELAERFYEKGPRRGEEALATYLELQIQAGYLCDEDSQVMAAHLVSLFSGSAVRGFVLGVTTKHPTAHSMRTHIKSVVSLFLRAYGRR